MKHKSSLFARRPNKSKKTSSLDTYPDELKIKRLSHEGRGVAKANGKTIFVAGALPNERVKYTIDKKHRRFDEAQCTDIIERSPMRSNPYCQHFDECGGCDLQHLDHKHQITEKQHQVLDQLERLGNFQPEFIASPINSPSWKYRRSCRIGINQKVRDGSALIGFRRKASNKLTPITNCPVLAEPLNAILSELPNCFEGEENFKEITHAELALGESEGSFCIRVKKRPNTALCKKLEALAEKHQFKLYLDYGKGPEAYGAEAALSYSQGTTNTNVNFKPGDFIQVNASVNSAMIDLALQWLELESDDRVLDLFCGIGNFTLPMATQAGQVVGVEGVSEMVSRSKENAILNDLVNCEFYQADLTKDLRATPWYKQGFNKVLIDPPRTGALEIIKQLKGHKIDAILYVSCNPAALARDGAELISQGYRNTRFCVMDMFPHTSHVESLALFERESK